MPDIVYATAVIRDRQTKQANSRIFVVGQSAELIEQNIHDAIALFNHEEIGSIETIAMQLVAIHRFPAFETATKAVINQGVPMVYIDAIKP